MNSTFNLPNRGGRRLVPLFSLIIFSLALFPANPASRLSDSLSRLQGERRTAEPFHFAVAGNTRDALPYIQSPQFGTIISQVNDRQPAFFALLGDLIRGHNLATASREWEEFSAAAALCRLPVAALPGDDDIWSEASRGLWEERIGPRWYSFDYGESHFIFLDTEQHTRKGITGAQREWLKWDLGASGQAKSIFVFLHRPLFLESSANWEPVHRLLQRYPVKAVFAAHYGRFEMLEPRDGISYFITGGGGAEITEPPEVGGFHHWLLVRVEGGQYAVTVMKADEQSLPPDAILRQNRAAILAARRQIRLSTLEAQVGKAVDTEVHVSFPNRSPLTLAGRLDWNAPSRGWNFDKTYSLYSLPGFKDLTLDFWVKTEDSTSLLGPPPYCSLDYFYGYEHKPVRLTRGLPVVRKLEVARAQAPVVADGKLNEWKDVEPIPLVNRLGSEPQSAADFSASVRLLWSERRFYLALEVRDDLITRPAAGAEVEWDVDHFRLFLNPFDKTGTMGGRGLYEYVGCQSPAGAQLYLLSDPLAARQHRLAPNVSIGSNRANGVTTYELIFDDASLSPLPLKPGDLFAMNLLVGDDDGPRHPEKFTLLALAGSGLMAGDSWPNILIKLAP